MSKESYLRKLFRQVKESYDLPKDPKIKKALEDPNTTRDQKRELLGAARQKKVDNIARLSRPVESHLNRNGSSYAEQNPEAETNLEPGFNEDIDSNVSDADARNDPGQLARLQQEALNQELSETGSQNLSPQEKAGALPKPAPNLVKTAKEAPPGGWLERVRRRLPQRSVAKTGGETAGKATGEMARQASKQIASQISNAIKKAAVAAAKKIAMSLAANPYFWLIVGGILLAIILFAVAFSLIRNDSTRPSVRGKTPTIQVNPKTDWATISQVLKLAGDQTVADQSINESLDNFSKYLKDIEEDINTKNPANKDAFLRQLTLTKEALILLKGTKSPANAKSFLTELGKLSDLVEDNFDPYPNDASHATRIPVEGTIPSFNQALHGNSFLYPQKTTGKANDVYTTDNAGEDKCDAVDVGARPGSNVYPIFAGEVISDPEKPAESSDGTSDGKFITIKDGDYTATYIHLIGLSKKRGERIEIAEALGQVRTNHIQIEIMHKGNCLVTTHADQIDHGMKDRRHEKWGDYLWDRIKTKFNLK